MRKITITLILVSLLTISAHAFVFTVREGHPRIFITEENLPILRQRAATTHVETYQAIKDWCDSNWDDLAAQKYLPSPHHGMQDYGDLKYALMYQLGQIPGAWASSSRCVRNVFHVVESGEFERRPG